MNTKIRTLKKIVFFCPTEEHIRFFTKISDILWKDFAIKSHVVIIEEENVNEKDVASILSHIKLRIVEREEKAIFAVLKIKYFTKELKKYLNVNVPIIEVDNNTSDNNLSNFMINVFQADFKKL